MSRSSASHIPADSGRTTAGQPGVLLRAMRALEGATRLDRLVALEQPVADVLLASPTRRRLLQGQPVGHALHPPATDLPIGLWMSSVVLDLAGARYAQSADLLLALGVVSAMPAALTGLADWGTAAPRTNASASCTPRRTRPHWC